MRGNNWAAKNTLEMFPESAQTCGSPQPSVDSPVTAPTGPQTMPSPQPSVDSAVTAGRPQVFLDPNGGFKSGENYVFTGRHLKTGAPTKAFTMEHAFRYFAEMPPSDIFCELAILPNGTGVTWEWIARVEGLRHRVWVVNTREVYRGRKLIGHSGQCPNKPAGAKKCPCQKCTQVDIDGLEALAKEMVHGTYKWFYRPRPKSKRSGSKNRSGDLQARINTRLNDLRLGREDRDTFQASCPKWIVDLFRGSFMAAENIVVTAQEVLKEPHKSRRFYLKVLANYANARKCQQFSTWNYHALEYRHLVNNAAKELWDELRARTVTSPQTSADSRFTAPVGDTDATA